jgi:hypothetical protein
MRSCGVVETAKIAGRSVVVMLAVWPVMRRGESRRSEGGRRTHAVPGGNEEMARGWRKGKGRDCVRRRFQHLIVRHREGDAGDGGRRRARTRCYELWDDRVRVILHDL